MYYKLYQYYILNTGSTYLLLARIQNSSLMWKDPWQHLDAQIKLEYFRKKFHNLLTLVIKPYFTKKNAKRG